MPVDALIDQTATASAAPVSPRPRRHSHARPRRRLPTPVAAIGWVVVLALLVVVLMRMVAWDAFEPFAVLNTVTAFIYLPAWIVLVVAALGRRPFLAVAALVVVIAQVVFVLPELAAAQPAPAWTSGAPTIRLFDANVYASNSSMAGYVRELTATRPDLVTLEEANPIDAAELARGGALDGLPYRIEIKRYDPTAFLIASRYPLTGANAIYDFGRPLIVQTTVMLPSGPLALWVVHTIAALPSSFAQWKDQLATIDTYLRRRGPRGLLLVGDFNSTWGNKGFRQLLDDGMTDGAAARGKAFDMTWSQTKPVVPPLVRIDHVLTGSGIAVTTIATGNGPGSDHRDLTATVAIRR
jgi:endonuclease/exonuclease/phosphatase (EEP) superfamily protein YafD